MKILYLKDTFEPRYSMRDEVQIALQAKKRSHDVTVFTSMFDLDLKRRDNSFFESQDKHMEGIKIIRPKSFKIPLFSSVFYVPSLKIFDGYDIIHAHNLGSYSSFLASTIKLTKKVKMILKADFSEIFYKKLIMNHFFRKNVLKPAHLADAITTYTTKEKSLLVDLGIPADKIWVIPVGINYEEFSNLRRCQADFVIVGYMGRFSIQKGIHKIVRPLKRLLQEYQNIKVVFAGQKTDVRYAEGVIAELERHNRFEYIGFINSSKDFYSNVDIILIPSLWETGSIITLEAMAAGKAVIASEISPHQDYIEQGISGFLAKNEEDFFRYCRKLVENKDLREMLGKNAKEKAKKYDWGNIFGEVEEMYNSVIE